MITFHNNLTKAKIANELIMSVQSLNILHLNYSTKSCLISWPCTFGQTLNATDFSCAVSGFSQSPDVESQQRNSNGQSSWLQWCSLSVSHEARLLQSENLTRKQLTAAILLLIICGFSVFRIFPTGNEGKCQIALHTM